jgi:hypothetical membrane protein
MTLRRLGVLCGVISPVLWLSLIFVAGALRPEFSHITQYISELGERGGPTESLMRYAGFEFTGFLYLCFAATLPAIIQDGWRSVLGSCLIALDGMGRMGAGVFPCDLHCAGVTPTQHLHYLFATLGFSSAILAAIAWGVIFERHAWLRNLTWYSIGSGLLALVLLLLMMWSARQAGTPGVFEHLATAVLSVWLLVFAARVARGET